MADSIKLGDKDYALVPAYLDEDSSKGPGDPGFLYPGEEATDGTTEPVDPKPF